MLTVSFTILPWQRPIPFKISKVTAAVLPFIPNTGEIVDTSARKDLPAHYVFPNDRVLLHYVTFLFPEVLRTAREPGALSLELKEVRDLTRFVWHSQWLTSLSSCFFYGVFWTTTLQTSFCCRFSVFSLYFLTNRVLFLLNCPKRYLFLVSLSLWREQLATVHSTGFPRHFVYLVQLLRAHSSPSRQ